MNHLRVWSGRVVVRLDKTKSCWFDKLLSFFIISIITVRLNAKFIIMIPMRKEKEKNLDLSTQVRQNCEI